MNNKKNILIITALGLISYATILVELILTKFISYKVYHHFAYAIISFLMFAFGLAGIIVYIFNKEYGNDSQKNWFNCAKVSFIGALTQMAIIMIFANICIDPANTGLTLYNAGIILPFCILIFMLPFLFVGIAITHTFTASKIDIRFLYFIDLLLAGFGAISSIKLIELLGGFGIIFLCSLCYFTAGLCYLKLGSTNFKKDTIIYSSLFSVFSLVFINFPNLMIKKCNIDIISLKSPQLDYELKKNKFHGFSKTYWNSIARIDLSKTVEDTDLELLTWGLSLKKINKPLIGRYILVDGGAATRQLKLPTKSNSMSLVASSVFALPYIIDNRPQHALVIGGGGGIDILIGKYFKISNLDVCEFNPSLFNVLTGKADDPDRKIYYPYLKSNNYSNVNIYNREGRHFVSASKEGFYDIIQMSGVDTLTAISGGGLSLAENYLYTLDAVKSYYKLLTPNGILSQTHWYQIPANCAIRQFLTYLEFLKSIGIKNPQRNLLVVTGNYTEIVLKKSPFTEQEINKVEKWCQDCGYLILYNPCDNHTLSSQSIYSQIALADEYTLKKLLNEYMFDITPVTDDKPYFYRSFKPNKNLISKFKVQGFFLEDQTYNGMLVAGLIGAFLLMFLPMFALSKNNQTSLEKPSFTINIFFALSGFSFLLFELAIMQILGIFVGGPFYTMAIVLVSILIGYSLGSLIASYLKINNFTHLFIGCFIGLINILYYFQLRNFINQYLSIDLNLKFLIAAASVLIVAIPMGMYVPSAANMVKDKYGNIVAWMIGINYAFNVLGGLCFVTISQTFGISSSLLITGIIYILSGIIFSTTCWPKLNNLKP